MQTQSSVLLVEEEPVEEKGAPFSVLALSSHAFLEMLAIAKQEERRAAASRRLTEAKAKELRETLQYD